jgi:hypothetical protein
MDENRLVDLLLVAILVLGTAALIGLYSLKPLYQENNPVSSTSLAERAALNHHDPPGHRVSIRLPRPPVGPKQQQADTSRDAAHPSQEDQRAAAPQNTSQTDDRPIREGEAGSSRDATLMAVSDATAVQGHGVPEPAEPVFQETSKDNGNFYLAQEIEGGVTTGKRGSVEDRADFYKIVAEGDRMILEMPPSLTGEDNGLTLAVFDANRTLMESPSHDMKGIKAFSVKPQATYYIKMDLRNTPIEAPPYRLRIRFDQSQ